MINFIKISFIVGILFILINSILYFLFKYTNIKLNIIIGILISFIFLAIIDIILLIILSINH